MNSNPKKGSGNRKEKIPETVSRTTSPANILPNKRKESDMIFVISETISKAPTKRRIGLREINLLIYSLTPRVFMLIMCVAARDTKARARVVFKSVVALLKKGITWPCPFSRPIVVMPGMSPLQFASKIKIKKVIKYGKI